MKELLDLTTNLYVKSFKDKLITDDILVKIDKCKNILNEYVNFAIIQKEFDLYFNENGAYIKEGDVFIGNDITNHLKGYNKVFFFIVTLGNEVDRQINKLQYLDLTCSYILDEMASILVDIKSDKIQDNIRKNKTISERYSCGYGDYSLSKQYDICKLLHSEKIGVKLTNGGMFNPTKTISAVIGIKE